MSLCVLVSGGQFVCCWFLISFGAWMEALASSRVTSEGPLVSEETPRRALGDRFKMSQKPGREWDSPFLQDRESPKETLCTLLATTRLLLYLPRPAGSARF